jgi:hypothetical protein
MSEKNTPIDRDVPEFWKVERIPEATPRCRAGTLLVIADVLGSKANLISLALPVDLARG